MKWKYVGRPFIVCVPCRVACGWYVFVCVCVFGGPGAEAPGKTFKHAFRAFLSLVGTFGRGFGAQLAVVFLLVNFQQNPLRGRRVSKLWRKMGKCTIRFGPTDRGRAGFHSNSS